MFINNKINFLLFVRTKAENWRLMTRKLGENHFKLKELSNQWLQKQIINSEDKRKGINFKQLLYCTVEEDQEITTPRDIIFTKIYCMKLYFIHLLLWS